MDSFIDLGEVPQDIIYKAGDDELNRAPLCRRTRNIAMEDLPSPDRPILNIIVNWGQCYETGFFHRRPIV